MVYKYIIEVTMPNTGAVGYIAEDNDIVDDPRLAIRYPEHSVAAQYRINGIPNRLNPRLIDGGLMLGTYISTYNGKFTFSKIIDVIGNSHLLSLITLPIMLPIALIIRIINEIDERY
jgi:hypothetical protein